MNMTNRIIKRVAAITLLLITGTTGIVNAQYDAMFTQFMNNEMFINPAYTGTKEALALNALHRQQWMGFGDGRPVTTTFSAHAPLMANKMGVGLSFLNENIGVLDRNLIYASYAYHLQVNERDYLSLGLMGGVHLQLNKFADVSTLQSGDPEFSANTPTVATPNFGFGAYYHNDKFYAGVSIPRMIDDNIQVNSSGTVVKDLTVEFKSFHYYLMAGRLFNVNHNLKLKPQAMVKMAQGAQTELDFNVSALIKERLWVGASYRTGADVSGLLGVYITPQMLLGYSYDFALTKMQDYTTGSHELSLSYVFGFGGKKIVSPRYF